jgi:hypothetical protein
MMSTDLNVYQKTNRMIWISIITGVIILTGIVLVFNRLQIFYTIPNITVVGEILFLIALGLGIAILVLKRTMFRLDKVLEQGLALTDTARQENFVLVKIRRNYIVLWLLAEMIGLLGFIFYLFTADLQNYLLFAVVSLYSLVINYPREQLIKIVLTNLPQSGSGA